MKSIAGTSDAGGRACGRGAKRKFPLASAIRHFRKWVPRPFGCAQGRLLSLRSLQGQGGVLTCSHCWREVRGSKSPPCRQRRGKDGAPNFEPVEYVLKGVRFT